MLPLPSYQLPSKAKREEHHSPRSISRRREEKDLYTKSAVHSLESRALVRLRMSKTLTSREDPSELFSEMVQLTAPSWGFRPLRFPPNQSSKQ